MNTRALHSEWTFGKLLQDSGVVLLAMFRPEFGEREFGETERKRERERERERETETETEREYSPEGPRANLRLERMVFSFFLITLEPRVE